MKQRYLIGIVLFVAVLCIPLSAFANNTSNNRPRRNPACVVRCAFNGPCRTCTGGGTARFCETFNCGACEESDCEDRIGGILAKKETSYQTASISKEPETLTIPSRVIREIGSVHPRFAITLIEMGSYGITPSNRHVYWTPVKLSSADVEAFLNKETNRRFFKRYNKEVRRLNLLIQKGELSDIVYAVSIKRTEVGSWSIKMKVEGELTAASVDPAYSTLELQVETPQLAQATLGGKTSSQKKVTWQIQ